MKNNTEELLLVHHDLKMIKAQLTKAKTHMKEKRAHSSLSHVRNALYQVGEARKNCSEESVVAHHLAIIEDQLIKTEIHIDKNDRQEANIHNDIAIGQVDKAISICKPLEKINQKSKEKTGNLLSKIRVKKRTKN